MNSPNAIWSWRTWTCLLGLQGIMLLGGPCTAGAEELKLADLPKAVRDTVKGRYPDGELKEARLEKEGDRDVYEVELTNSGVAIEIAVFNDGTIDWVAVDLPVRNLPRKVSDSVRNKYPGSKVTHASSVYTVKEGKDHLEHYYVEVTTKSGKLRGLDVLPDGTIEEDVDASE